MEAQMEPQVEAKLRLKIKTLWGKVEEVEIDASGSVGDLKNTVALLTTIPNASQRLMYGGRPMREDASLAELRVHDGDSVVLVPMRAPKPRAEDPTPIPTRQAIYAATGGPPRRQLRVAPRGLVGAANPYAQFRNQLQELMNTLMGLHEDAPSSPDETPSSPDVAMAPADVPPTDETAPPAASEAAPMVTDSPTPEPAAQAALPEVNASLLKQLTEMGFPEWPAKKALILCRMNVQYAMEWLLEHSDDPNLNDPLPPQLLTAMAAPAAEFVPNADAVRVLSDMGFSSEDIVQALRVTNNNQEAAAAWLLGDRELQEEGMVGLSPEEASIVGSVLANPVIAQSLANPRILSAMREILEDPSAAGHYINDPEIGPVLMSVSNLIRRS
eukprot:TRINITY_DN7340_c0_g1_i1.p1 TRINITY_DN7340_c0_g1~~TRINITY_DN7340_c0_g1_i1.p1  ORF type:complete len:392 (+),score=78.35 TRINITY_DN7340_c0_g1_i1:22-1176(+)